MKRPSSPMAAAGKAKPRTAASKPGANGAASGASPEGASARPGGEQADNRSVEDLTTDRTLSRKSLHKTAIDQVFMTDWMLGPGDDWCTIAGRLPLAHARYSDTAAPYHDIVMLSEVVRQAGLVVAEEWIKVPSDRQFILREMKVKLDPIEHARRSRDTCDVLISQDPSSKVKMRAGRSAAGGMMRSRITIGGKSAGHSDVMGLWVPDNVYSSMRKGKDEATSGQALPEPTPRADVETRVGKRNPANSVLTPLRESGEPRGYESSLVIEKDDPTFFDHPLDHVPGLYMLEGIQQVSIAAACQHLGLDHSQVALSEFHLSFERIAEFQPDPICAIVLDEDGSGGKVTLSQDGNSCCEGTVQIARV